MCEFEPEIGDLAAADPITRPPNLSAAKVAKDRNKAPGRRRNRWIVDEFPAGSIRRVCYFPISLPPLAGATTCQIQQCAGDSTSLPVDKSISSARPESAEESIDWVLKAKNR
jgi:hypothetical protein